MSEKSLCEVSKCVWCHPSVSPLNSCSFHGLFLELWEVLSDLNARAFVVPFVPVGGGGVTHACTCVQGFWNRTLAHGTACIHPNKGKMTRSVYMCVYVCVLVRVCASINWNKMAMSCVPFMHEKVSSFESCTEPQTLVLQIQIGHQLLFNHHWLYRPIEMKAWLGISLDVVYE